VKKENDNPPIPTYQDIKKASRKDSQLASEEGDKMASKKPDVATKQYYISIYAYTNIVLLQPSTRK